MFGGILRILSRGNARKRRPVVFIHIPKTGGKSFERLLRQNYPDDNLVIRIYRTGGQDLGEVFAKVPRQKLDNAELIYGHIPHRIETYLGRECEYFTILRDPVERILSFYRYVKYDFTEHPLHPRFKTGELTLETFLLSDNLENNKMTKMLAGFDVREEPKAFMLDKAKRNLMKMKAFGLLERFDESCLLIAKRLKWRNPFYIRSNVTSAVGKQEVFDDAVRAIVAEENGMDVELYDFARERFKDLMSVNEGAFVRAVIAYKNLLRDEVFMSQMRQSSLWTDECSSEDIQAIKAYLNG